MLREVAEFLVRVFETPKVRYAHSRALMERLWAMLIPALRYDAMLGMTFWLKAPKSAYSHHEPGT